MRKTARSIVWFITMLCLLSSVSAANVTDVALTDTLKGDGSLEESITIRIVGNVQDAFLFTLPVDATNVRLNGTPLAVVNGSVRVPLACKGCLIHLSYTLRDASVFDGAYMTFSRTLNLPVTPQRLNYSIALPHGYGVGSATSSDPPIVPAATALETDGERIIVTWTQDSPQFPIRYYLSSHQLEQFTSFAEFRKELNEWAARVIALVAFLLGVGAGLFFARLLRQRRMRVELPSVPASLLNPDEKAILSVLRRSSAPLSQKEVGKALAWSKSKISAIMSNLEYKKIVRREKIGRNYKVELLKDVED